MLFEHSIPDLKYLFQLYYATLFQEGFPLDFGVRECENSATRSGEEVWGAVSIPMLDTEMSRWGCGQGSMQDTCVFSH